MYSNKEVFVNSLSFGLFLSGCRAILRFMSHKEKKQRKPALEDQISNLALMKSKIDSFNSKFSIKILGRPNNAGQL